METKRGNRTTIRTILTDCWQGIRNKGAYHNFWGLYLLLPSSLLTTSKHSFLTRIIQFKDNAQVLLEHTKVVSRICSR